MVETATHVGPRMMYHEDRTEFPRPVWSSGWGAVLAGAVVAIGVQFIFTVLGLGLGISAAASETDRIAPIGVGAGVWWLITGTISLAIGGAVLGALWDGPSGKRLWLHAATLWGVVAIFGFMVIWSGAGIVSNAVSPLTVREPEWSDRPTPEERAARADQAKDAAKTAAWWSVFGLLIGITATVAGAAAAGPPTEHPRQRRAQPAL